MGAVNVQATFKKESKDLDGLGAISDELVADPLRRVMIVAEVEVTRITKDIRDGGTTTPTVRWTSVEVMRGDRELDARKMRDEAYSERTGQTAPPPTLFDQPPPVEGDADPDAPEAKPWPGDAPAAQFTDGDQAQETSEGDGAVKHGRRK